MTEAVKSYLDSPKGPASLPSPFDVKTASTAQQPPLVRRLLADLAQGRDANTQASCILNLLKELSRLSVGSSELAKRESLEALLSVIPEDKGSNDARWDLAKDALRCINNAIFQHEASRATFASDDVKGAHRAVELVRLAPSLDTAHAAEVLFLCSRLVFFATLFASDFNRTAVEELGWVEASRDAMIFLLTPFARGTATSPLHLQALAEILKALFNSALYYPKLAKKNGSKNGIDEKPAVGENWNERLAAVLEPTIAALRIVPATSPADPLAQPRSAVIALLLNYPVGRFRDAYLDEAGPSGLPSAATKRPDATTVLLDTLDQATALHLTERDPDHAKIRARAAQRGINVDEALRPIILLLRKMAAEEPELGKKLKRRILPDDIDRTTGLDKRDDLTGRLIRLMPSISMPHLATAAGELLLATCGGDAKTMVDEIGYGPCAGFLTNAGLLGAVPTGMRSAASPDGQQGSSERLINPITGAYAPSPEEVAKAEAEDPHSLSNMTEEEREREAEKLMHLFDRLNRTGVVQAKDPRAAMREENPGRFQEIEDKVEREAKEEEDREEAEAMRELASYKARKAGAQAGSTPS